MATARERGEISSRDFGGAGQGLLGVDSRQARARCAVDGGRPRDRGPGRHGASLRPARARAAARRCSRRPSRRSRRRAGCRSSAPCAPAASRARPASPTTSGSRASGARSRPRSRSSSPTACSSACACASSATPGSCRPRTPSARSRATQKPTGAFLLSPFDNLLWDRFEAEHLFGFEHRLEIYKPAPTRIYGYYVLPLLDGPEVVGRVDMKADRKAGTLRALAVHWQRRATAAGAARGPRAARPCARAREERDPEWSLRRARSMPGRSPIR